VGDLRQLPHIAAIDPALIPGRRRLVVRQARAGRRLRGHCLRRGQRARFVLIESPDPAGGLQPQIDEYDAACAWSTGAGSSWILTERKGWRV